jgi:hypothetical protein
VAATQQAVAVEGLAELRRALKDIGGLPLQKNLRAKFLKVGEEIAADAREHVPVGPKKKNRPGGQARASVKAGVSGNNAYVQEGKKSVPYMGWLDFGGVLKPTGKRKNTIKRPRIKGGRYLYPAIGRKRDRITEAAQQALEETGRELGLH